MKTPFKWQNKSCTRLSLRSAHGLYDVFDELLAAAHTVLLEHKLNFPFKPMPVHVRRRRRRRGARRLPGARRRRGARRCSPGLRRDKLKQLDAEWLDEVLKVDDEQAFDWGKRLAREEGIMAGISSGATCCSHLLLCVEGL